MTSSTGRTRTSTRSWASPRTPRPTRSRRPTASWRAPTTPTPTPATQAAEERFKAIAEAYDVIGDTEKRKEYDEKRSMFAAASVPSRGRRRPRRRHVRRQRPLRRHRGGSGSAAAASATCSAGMFGGSGGGRTARAPRAGADIETEATISFADSVDGVTVSLRLTSDAPCPDCCGTGAKAGTMPRVCPDCEGVGMRAASVGGAFTMNETCPTCGGRGLVVDDPCPTCHGSGRGMSNRTISARIPAGVKDGQRIRLRGKGASGERGGPPGDLYVTVQRRRRTRCSAVSGDNLTSPCRCVRRGGARRRHQGADARRRAGHGQDPAGHAQRPHVPGARQGRAAQGRASRRPAGHRRGAGPGAARRRRRRAGRARPPRPRPREGDLRAELFDAGSAAMSQPARTVPAAGPARRCRST